MLHRNNERVLNLQKDKLLDLKALHSFMVNNHILPDALHRIHLVVFLVLDQIYFSKSTSANKLQDFEIIKSKLRDISLVTRHRLPCEQSLSVSVCW